MVLTDNIKCCILRMSDLLRLEAEGNYSRVYWIGSSMLIRRPLRDCEKRLDPTKFFRARRDCIINLEHVKHTRIVDLMRYVFVLQDGTEVTLSRRQSLACASRDPFSTFLASAFQSEAEGFWRLAAPARHCSSAIPAPAASPSLLCCLALTASSVSAGHSPNRIVTPGAPPDNRTL